MIQNYDKSVEINHNRNWAYFLDIPRKILIIGGSELWTWIRKQKDFYYEKQNLNKLKTNFVLFYKN